MKKLLLLIIPILFLSCKESDKAIDNREKDKNSRAFEITVQQSGLPDLSFRTDKGWTIKPNEIAKNSESNTAVGILITSPKGIQYYILDGRITCKPL